MKDIHWRIVNPAFLLLTALIFLQGCSIDDDVNKIKKGSWSPNVIVPLIDSKLSVDDILNKTKGISNFIDTSGGGLITLIYRGNVFSSKGKDLLVVPDQNYSQSTALPNITFSDFTVRDSISLGRIALGLQDPEKSTIIALHGLSGVTFPPIPTQAGSTFNFQANSQFQNVTFASGTLIFTVQNKLPIPIQPLTMRLVNNIDGSTIGTLNFPSIASNSTATDSFPVGGKTFSNDLSFAMDAIGSPGASNVSVDTGAQRIVFAMLGRNISVSSGTGIIPAGSSAGTDTINLNTGTGDVLSKLIFKSGTFSSGISSVALNGIQVTLKFLNITSSTGTPLQQTYLVGNNNNVINLDGYTAAFINNGQYTNGIVMEYNVESQGQTVTYAAGDTLSLSLSMNDITFSYAEGQLGYHAFTLDADTFPLNIYKNWSGSIFFEDPSIEVVVTNYFGFPIAAKFTQLEAQPRSGGPNVQVTGPGIAPDSIKFNYPSLAQVGQGAETRIKMDSVSIRNVIASSPVNFFYSIGAASIASPPVTGFVLDTSYFSVDVEVALPLWGRFDSILFIDTLRLDAPSLDNYDYANFKLYTINGFPLAVSLQIYFFSDTVNLDPNNSSALVDSLLGPNQTLFQAAQTDGNGNVVQAATNEMWIPFTQARYANIRNTKAMLLKAGLQTLPKGQSVKFYSDYYLGVKLGMQSNLTIR